jgi:hypothetical protein
MKEMLNYTVNLRVTSPCYIKTMQQIFVTSESSPSLGQERRQTDLVSVHSSSEVLSMKTGATENFNNSKHCIVLCQSHDLNI